MADADWVKPTRETYGRWILEQAARLRKGDHPPVSLNEWKERRASLRESIKQALGAWPEKDMALEAKIIDTLPRQGFRIEKLIFQSSPGVWVTGTAYVPEKTKGKCPAVLAVHGHWAWARREPTVQARCLGLVKLGFFVLAVDAFGAGERFDKPAAGTYHGAFYGSSLWPAGMTLLGRQVYDNRRAVDYLLTRPEVDGERLGITGASGGGNQSMNAGAFDERFKAVAPVCSVGTYQAYLKAACCVCEVLPGALKFTEEGDVLGLVAPRALMVINATRDAFQFSVGEAQKSLERARSIFKLYDAGSKVKHVTFDCGHDYNQAMREAMYGFMTQWLKGEGDGRPIPEPAFDTEKPEALACLSDKTHPKVFLFPPSLAQIEGQALLAHFRDHKPDHLENWDSQAVFMRSQLKKTLEIVTPEEKVKAKLIKGEGQNGPTLLLQVEPGLLIEAALLGYEDKPFQSGKAGAKQKAAIVFSLEGKAEAQKNPIVGELVKKGRLVLIPELRATGSCQPGGDLVHNAVDHNSAEHGVWIGRPLLGQWISDLAAVSDWLAFQPELDKRSIALIGIGEAGIVAISASGVLEDSLATTAIVEGPMTFLPGKGYDKKMRMGLFAPGILKIGDVPHLAGLIAPRRTIISGAVHADGSKPSQKEVNDHYAFTTDIYKLHGVKDKLIIHSQLTPAQLVESL